MAYEPQALPGPTITASSPMPQWLQALPPQLQSVVAGPDGQVGMKDLARWQAILSNPAMAALFYGGKELAGYLGEHAVPTEQDRPAPVDPYGTVGQDYTNFYGQNPADQFGSDFGSSMSERFNSIAMPSGSGGPQEFGSQFGQPSYGGSGMSVSRIEIPGMPGGGFDVISGPQWEGPPGLPWTYGADPRSYPYAYIPPGESWANVGAGGGGWPGQEPPGGERVALRPEGGFIGPRGPRSGLGGQGFGNTGGWEGYDSMLDTGGGADPMTDWSAAGAWHMPLF